MSGKVWAVYIRRSSKREGHADVNDETPEAVARGARLARRGGHAPGQTECQHRMKDVRPRSGCPATLLHPTPPRITPPTHCGSGPLSRSPAYLR